MKTARAFPLVCFIACLLPGASSAAQNAKAIVPSSAKELIDFRDPAKVRARRPILIAHRGGVITSQIPECSLAAIREASKWGYDAIELDIRRTRDGAAVIFHDANLKAACGLDTTIAQLSESEARAIRYRKNNEPIANLDEALALCRQLNLGIMLDFKDGTLQPDFLRQVAGLLRKHGLGKSTVAISGNPLVREELRAIVVVPITAAELEKVGRDEPISLQGLYWFGIPSWIKWDLIPKLQRAGALVVPALNTFRYEKDVDRRQARDDARRLMEIGVDGFQIDAAYQDFFGRPLP